MFRELDSLSTFLTEQRKNLVRLVSSPILQFQADQYSRPARQRPSHCPTGTRPTPGIVPPHQGSCIEAWSVFIALTPSLSTDDATIDVALSAKTTDILSYSKDQLSPLLNDAVGVVKTVIAAASTKATETKEAGEELAATAEKKTVETAQVVEKEVKVVGQKAKKAKVNGAAH